jgi:hypothetical protein
MSAMNKVAGVTAGWEVKELGAVSAINYGYTESASSEPIGPRFLRITDIQDDQVDWASVPYCKIESADLPKYRLASGDIVFARTGATTGKSFLVADPPDAVFASYLIRLRLLDKKLLPKFVSLFFQTFDAIIWLYSRNRLIEGTITVEGMFSPGSKSTSTSKWREHHCFIINNLQ